MINKGDNYWEYSLKDNGDLILRFGKFNLKEIIRLNKWLIKSGEIKIGLKKEGVLHLRQYLNTYMEEL